MKDEAFQSSFFVIERRTHFELVMCFQQFFRFFFVRHKFIKQKIFFSLRFTKWDIVGCWPYAR